MALYNVSFSASQRILFFKNLLVKNANLRDTSNKQKCRQAHEAHEQPTLVIRFRSDYLSLVILHFSVIFP